MRTSTETSSATSTLPPPISLPGNEPSMLIVDPQLPSSAATSPANSIFNSASKFPKFKRLLAHTLTLVLVATTVPIGLSLLDLRLPEQLEESVIPSKTLSPLGKDIKKEIMSTQDYMRQVFKSTAHEAQVNTINLKIRANYSWSQFLPARQDYNANSSWNYINFPLNLIEEEIKEARSLQLISQEGIAQKKEGSAIVRDMLDFMKKNESRTVLTNIFLNYSASPTEEKRALDFLLFHEFTHTVIEAQIEAKKTEVVKQSLELQKSMPREANLISLEEGACDIMAALLVIKKQNLSLEEATDFLHKQIAFRFSTRQTLINAKAATGKNYEAEHDTESGLYLLTQWLQKEDIDALKKLTPEQLLDKSVELAEKNFYIAQTSQLKEIKPGYQSLIAQKLNIPSNELDFELAILDDNIVGIAEKNSLFYKTKSLKITPKKVSGL